MVNVHYNPKRSICSVRPKKVEEKEHLGKLKQKLTEAKP